MTTDSRITLTDEGDKDNVLQPTTLQTEPTMSKMCKMLFKTKIDNFELLPWDDDNYGRYGTWALYIEYRGLHYYLLIHELRDNILNCVYDKSNPLDYRFEAVRTNFKIPGLFMVPSDLKFLGDEINFKYMKIYGIYDTASDTDIIECVTYSGREEYSGGDWSYYRYEKTKYYCNQTCMSKEQEELIEFITLPYGFVSALDITGKGENFISYYAPDIVSITEEKYNDMVDVIFNNAHQKRFEEFTLIVGEISPLNDNCIEHVLQYVF